MDRALKSSAGLRIDEFAGEHGVSERTVRRELKVFAKLGYKSHTCKEEGQKRPYWQYDAKVDWMFFENCPNRVRHRLKVRFTREEHEAMRERIELIELAEKITSRW